MGSYSLLMDAKASLKIYFGKYAGFTFKTFVTCMVSISSDFFFFFLVCFGPVYYVRCLSQKTSDLWLTVKEE